MFLFHFFNWLSPGIGPVRSHLNQNRMFMFPRPVATEPPAVHRSFHIKRVAEETKPNEARSLLISNLAPILSFQNLFHDAYSCIGHASFIRHYAQICTHYTELCMYDAYSCRDYASFLMSHACMMHTLVSIIHHSAFLMHTYAHYAFCTQMHTLCRVTHA